MRRQRICPSVSAIAVSLAFVLTSPSLAGDLAAVRITDESALLADLTTITREGDTARMWTVMAFKDQKDAFYSRALSEYRCTIRQTRTVYLRLYDANNAPLEGHAAVTPWEYIIPDSIGETLWAAACNGDTRRLTKGFDGMLPYDFVLRYRATPNSQH